MDKLKDNIIAMEHWGEVSTALNGSPKTGDLNDRWKRFKDPVTQAAMGLG